MKKGIGYSGACRPSTFSELLEHRNGWERTPTQYLFRRPGHGGVATIEKRMGARETHLVVIASNVCLVQCRVVDDLIRIDVDADVD